MRRARSGARPVTSGGSRTETSRSGARPVTSGGSRTETS